LTKRAVYMYRVGKTGTTIMDGKKPSLKVSIYLVRDPVVC